MIFSFFKKKTDKSLSFQVDPYEHQVIIPGSVIEFFLQSLNICVVNNSGQVDISSSTKAVLAKHLLAQLISLLSKAQADNIKTETEFLEYTVDGIGAFCALTHRANSGNLFDKPFSELYIETRARQQVCLASRLLHQGFNKCPDNKSPLSLLNADVLSKIAALTAPELSEDESLHLAISKFGRPTPRS